MARKARLTDRLNRRLARLAREKGLTCPDCGSSGPVPKDGGELGARPDGGADVPMRCEECESASEMTLVLSPEEAEALGLHSLGERSEASELAPTVRKSDGGPEIRRKCNVGCCDSSKNKHATKHYRATDHPIVRSFHPGEDWIWCYADEVVMEPGR